MTDSSPAGRRVLFYSHDGTGLGHLRITLGVATASANGGAVAIGDVNSGGNAGSAIGVGDTVGTVAVDGGTMANSTQLSISANGGTAIADASGGDYNLAFVS